MREKFGENGKEAQCMMRKKKKKMHQSNHFGMKVITLVVVVLFGVLSYKTVSLHQKADVYQAKLDKYKEDMEKLEQDQKDIQELKEYVQSDAYIEDMAREKLGLVYKDEVIFQADEDE